MRLALLLLAMTAFAADPPSGNLGSVKHVYVESLGGSPQAVMLHDMIVSSLAASGLFAVTENAEHADATLRGSADDQVYVEQHHSSDSINVGTHSATSDNYSSRYDHTNDSKSSGLNIGQNETSNSADRRHEASASVRLVNRDGDVIWSTTQESTGAKFRSSSADVADKIVKKLTEDLQRARLASSAKQAGMPSR